METWSFVTDTSTSGASVSQVNISLTFLSRPFCIRPLFHVKFIWLVHEDLLLESKSKDNMANDRKCAGSMFSCAGASLTDSPNWRKRIWIEHKINSGENDIILS